MKGILRELVLNNTQISLSGEAIFKATGKHVIIYDDLKKFNSLDELLNIDDFQTILYVSNMGQGSISGHYCFIYRNERGVHFFDSYGLNVDDEIQFGKYEEKYLSKLLEDSGLQVFHNNIRYQELADQNPRHTAVCGAYCIMRHYTMNTMSDKTFHKLLTENKTEFVPDVLVCLLATLAYQ